MDVFGIIIAVIAALCVLFHARIRHLPFWAAIVWAFGTFFFLIIVLPVYILVHGPEPKPRDGDL